MLATKGSDDQNMWRRVSRCLDDIIKITGNINTSLNIHETDGVRKIDLSKEIGRNRKRDFVGKISASDC